MAVWYHYVCVDCGHGGLTQDVEGYKNGRYACPECGCLHFDVEDRDAAPVLDDDESTLEIDD